MPPTSQRPVAPPPAQNPVCVCVYAHAVQAVAAARPYPFRGNTHVINSVCVRLSECVCACACASCRLTHPPRPNAHPALQNRISLFSSYFYRYYSYTYRPPRIRWLVFVYGPAETTPSPGIPARHFCLKRTESFILAPPLTHHPCSTVRGSISLLPLIYIHIQYSPLVEHSSHTTLACLTPVKGILITQSFPSPSPTPEFSFLSLSVFSVFSSLPIFSLFLSPTHNLHLYPSVSFFSRHIHRLATKVRHLRPPLTCVQLLCETLIYSRCTVIITTCLFGHTFLSGPPRTVHHVVKF